MERRITNAKDTVPASTAFAGTVTSNTDQTILTYTGSDDIASIYTQGKISSVDSPSWIYVPYAGSYVQDVTQYIARVIGLYKLANGNYQIFLDRNFPNAAGSPCAWLRGPITYGILNDGGADALIMSGDKGSRLLTLATGENPGDRKAYQLYSNRIKLQVPMYVDATGTDVLVNEET